MKHPIIMNSLGQTLEKKSSTAEAARRADARALIMAAVKYAKKLVEVYD